MNIIFGLVQFILFFFLVIYFPGRLIIRITKFSSTSLQILVPISIAVGSSMYLFLIYILQFANIGFIYILIAIVASFFEFKNSILEFKAIFKKIVWNYLLIIIFGTICMSYITWNSGILNEGGDLIFYGLNAIDGIWHISLLQNLSNNYPPTHPGLSGYTFRGYNFFYDLFLVNFITYLRLSVYDVFYRFGTLFLALFYGLSCLGFAKYIRMSKNATIIFLILMYFTQGFAVTLFSLFSIFYDPGIPQTFAHVLGPNVLFSIALLLCFMILIFGSIKKTHVLLAALILGILPMVKIYTALLAFGSLSLMSIYFLIRFRDSKYIIALVLGGIIASVVYLPLNSGSGTLVFAPYLLYENFAHRFSDSNNIPLWSTLIEASRANNYVMIFWYKVIVLLGLFYIPSLGVRLASLIFIKRIFVKEFYTPINIFLLLFCVFGFLIPTLFIQNVAFFVVLQFLWISYFILLIPTSYAWEKIIFAFKGYTKIILFFIFLLLILPDSIKFIFNYSINPFIIKKEFITQTDYLKYRADPKDGILVLTTTKRGDEIQSIFLSPIVSSLIGRPVYYENEVLEVKDLENVIKMRKEKIFAIQNKLENCDDISKINSFIISEMKASKNAYIFDIQGFSCLAKLPGFRKVSSEGIYSIYKVIEP